MDKELVKIAISSYCRLGFARKKTLDVTPPKGLDWHTSWLDGNSVPIGAAMAGASTSNPSRPFVGIDGAATDAVTAAALDSAVAAPGLSASCFWGSLYLFYFSLLFI